MSIRRLLFTYLPLSVLALLLSGCDGPNLLERAENPFAYGCCGLVLLILDIVAIVDVVNNPWGTGRKVLWIALILIFPILGLILYYLFGRE